MKPVQAILAATSALTACAALAGPPLTLGYVTRPGLAELVDGKPAGTYLPLAVAAAEKAGFDVTLQSVAQPRLMAQVSSGQPNYCAVGIFVTPERQAFSKFSLPFYRTPRFVVVTTRAKEPALREHRTFGALLADPALKNGVLEGYSYGNTLDPLIARMRGNVDRFVGTFDQGFGKILAGRFDYMISFRDEVESWLARSGTSRDAISMLDFPDLLDGVPRHFMCSRAVDDATLDRLNAGITALRLRP